MGGAVDLAGRLPRRRFGCPNCAAAVATPAGEARTPLHPCPGMAGLVVPMVPAGVRAEHRVRLREDYVGGEMVARDGEGRVVMSVVTTRDDGEDCTVYAPCAMLTGRSE